MPKKYDVRILVGENVVKQECTDKELLSEYISNMRLSYKDQAVLLILDRGHPLIPGKETLSSEDI